MVYYIYKIVCNDVSITDFYVGSTTCFRKRKCCHKSICNNPNDNRYNVKIYQTIRENGGWDNWRMVIVEEMEEGTTLIQARIREEHYRVDLEASLNVRSAYIELTEKEYKKEYQQTNKEIIKEYKKKYYQTNKETIKEYEKANRDKINEQQRERRKLKKEKNIF